MIISIVIPAYNEAQRIAKTIQSIRKYRSDKGIDIDLIVSDDGSTDNTCEVVQKEADGLNYRILKSPQNKGKGHAVRQGVLASKGDMVLFCDADLSTPIEELDKLLKVLQEGADVAIGSRALDLSDVQVHQNFFRETMGKAFNVLARMLAFRGIHDSQCGFKCFRKDAARALFAASKIDGFCFDAEIMYLAQKKAFRVQEVPVVWRNSPQSKVSILSDPARMFLDLFRLRWLHRHDR